jgi:hypothetical protein
MGLKSNLPQKLCQANLQTLITYYLPRYHALPEYIEPSKCANVMTEDTITACVV